MKRDERFRLVVEIGDVLRELGRAGNTDDLWGRACKISATFALPVAIVDSYDISHRVNVWWFEAGEFHSTGFNQAYVDPVLCW